MKRILHVYGGPEFHPHQAEGELLAKILAADGRFEIDSTTDLDALASLPGGKYAVVIINATRGPDELTHPREQGLLDFVRNGGGLVGVHAAADSFRNSHPYVEMLGCQFQYHPAFQDFNVSIVHHDHYLTQRLPETFTISDEMYHLKNYDPQTATLLAQTPWQGQQMPMAYTKPYGKGRIAYLANGHDLRAWRHPEFQKLLVRAIAWSAGAEKPSGKIRCGLLGYGPAFNMGKGHAGWINAIAGMETVAMCDIVPERVEAARLELPGLRGYFTSLDAMLALDGLDLVVNILPHNLHASATIQCLQARKHVIVEKPFCLNVEEANRMIDAAHQQGCMLSVFHNRRWDHDYLAIRDIIQKGLIGELFHIEAFIGDYAHPGFWWRSDKRISGGVMHDWGAHFIDWILTLVPSPVKQVMGDFQKRVWNAVTNEDHGQAYIRFENGVTADFMISSIAASKRPKWRILGTAGSLEANWGEELILTTFGSGFKQESKVMVPKQPPSWSEYYRNIADHLLMGEELIVKPEQARRVIATIQAAQESSVAGVSVTPLVV